MFNRTIMKLDILVDPYRIYPDDDADFKGSAFLPIRDDAPDEIKEADKKIKEFFKSARKKGFAV